MALQRYTASLEIWIDAATPYDAAVQAESVISDAMRESFVWTITDEMGNAVNIDPDNADEYETAV